MAEDYLHEIGVKCEQQYAALNKNEKEVVDRIAETFAETDYGDDFFRDHTAKELTDIFGGSGDLVVNERVRATLISFYDEELVWREIEEFKDNIKE